MSFVAGCVFSFVFLCVVGYWAIKIVLKIILDTAMRGL